MTPDSPDISNSYQEQDSFRHDLRTHISAIMSLTELIRKAPTPDESAHLLDALHLAADNAMALMDGGIHRILTPSDKEVNLVDLLQDFKLLADGLVQPSQATFTLEIGKAIIENPHAALDAVQLHRVLMLLLDNALNYAKGADLQLSAERDSNDTITLLFSDNGPGFGTDNPDLLFLPYQRGTRHIHNKGQNKNHIKGSGLGLWSARNIVKAMGGMITAGNKDPNGATFTLSLPIHPLEPSIHTHDPSPQSDESNETGPQILIVDDNKTNHLIVGEMLRAMACHASHALTGERALEMMAECRPAMMLIDIRMAEMDGWELARQIRANPAWRSIPLYAVSSDDPPRNMDHFKGWLQRPVRPAQLLALLKDLPSPETSEPAGMDETE
jgi:CheY-like chemotaxis protein